MPEPYLIIDFDSTFVALESLDELARLALQANPQHEQIIQELTHITNLGMEGRIGFAESLERRLPLFEANRGHIEQLITLLTANVTPSVIRNRDFFRGQADRIYIMSGGFSDYIVRVVADFGIAPEHVLANRFIYDDVGNIIGYDKSLPLAHDNGKVEQVIALQLSRPLYAIGDGYTDYSLKAAGQAEKFFAFVENVRRENVVAEADMVLTNFDELVALELSAT